MTDTPRMLGESEQVYPLTLGKLVTQAVVYGLGFLVFIPVTYNVSLQEGWIGLGVFMGLSALVLLAMALDAIMKMPANKRIALAITDQGLRIPAALPALTAPRSAKAAATDLVPWAEIERILLVCFTLGGGQTAVAGHAAGGNTPHVRVMRKGGEPFMYTGPKARAYHVANATELAGGEAAYIQLARELIEWGAVKRVRVALVTSEGSRWIELLGNPPLADWSEMEHKQQGS